MHVPSEHHHRELHTVPEFVRVTLAKGKDNWEPTFLVKSTTLTLKYVTRLTSTRFAAFFSPNRFLIYGLRVFDHSRHPAFIWSVARRPEELRALKAIAAGECAYLVLFNEAAVNVAWAPWTTSGDTAILSRLASTARLPDSDPAAPEIGEFIDRFFLDAKTEAPFFESGEFGPLPWTAVNSTYITNSLGPSLLTLFADDEGGQQEELCHWLTDNIQPQGIWRSPQLMTASKTRELTDFLLSHRYGAFLFESKALSILQREPLPDRTQLTGDVAKHIAKAARQLSGALRNIKAGQKITDKDGRELTIEREKPPHAIILVPDLHLLHDERGFGPSFLAEFMKSTGAFLHILDPTQLFRVVQAAMMIAARGTSITIIEALDYYLMQRFEYAIEQDTPDFDMILRLIEEPTHKPELTAP